MIGQTLSSPVGSFAQFQKVLNNPLALLISLLGGLAVGVFAHPLAEILVPFGKLYLSLLRLCVLPILLSAITSSVGRLMRSPKASRSVIRILVIFPLSLLAVSGLACLTVIIFGPGRDLSANTLQSLGVLVTERIVNLEIPITSPIPPRETVGFVDFLFKLIPDNIFEALSNDEALKILFGSILFGLSLGLLKTNQVDQLLDLFDGFYLVFQKLIQGLTVLLPVGMFCLFAGQGLHLDLQVFGAMLKFLGVVVTFFISLYIGGAFLLAWRSQQPIFQILSILRETTVMAFATQSSIACLPGSIRAFESLPFDFEEVKLTLPLATTICRYGSVAYFGLAAPFVAQIYGNSLDLGSFLVISIACVFAGMATSGATGLITLSMLGLVLQPLQLPLDAVLVLFIAIDPLVDPLRTVGIVQTAMVSTSLIVERREGTMPISQV